MSAPNENGAIAISAFNVRAQTRSPPAASARSRLVTPLLAYYAIALAVPLANGAGSLDAPFIEHASFVVFAPLVMVVTLRALRYGWRRIANARRSVTLGKKVASC